MKFLNVNKHDIIYKKSIAGWDEALPLGNGCMGALIYGDGPLRIALDRSDLWDMRENPIAGEIGFNYKNLVSLVKSGKKEDWAEYERLFDSVYMDKPYPTKITACRMEIDFKRKTSNVHSRINLRRAAASVVAGNFRLECFLSAMEFIGVMRIYGEYRLSFHTPEYLGEKESGCYLGYPAAEITKEEEFTIYRQNTLTDFSYAVVVCEKRTDAYSDLYFTIVTTNDSKDFIAYAKKSLEKASRKGYQSLKKSHIVWWENYWNKSQIEIPDELLEQTYYRSWYLFASCSRKGFYPMPLQGLWTADNDKLPPWKGDYHHDTNTELSYQSYLKANRLEEGEVFLDYLWSLKPAFEKFAKEFYGVDGLIIPSCSTLDGKAMGGWPQYSLSPTMTIWAAQSFDEYWLYTGDRNFLKDRAYPFFKAIGKAISGLLKEKNGKLYLPLSTSPEIYNNEPRAYLVPNSNFDLALLRYLYKTLQGYAAILEKDSSGYATILGKLDEIAIDKDGVVLLDKTQRLPQSHRHFSHVMALYPLHLINYDTLENKRIYENTLLHLEQLGTGWWVGFSFAMSAQLYAMACNGNAAYEKLRAFAKGFVAENGFHLNGDFKNYGFSQWHYRPFTLEASFGFCDALQEMLLQEHKGYIEIFPAVPETWKKISFNDLRSYQGVLVSAQMKSGKVIEVVFKTKRNVNILLKNPFTAQKLLVNEEAINAQPWLRLTLMKGTTIIRKV